MEAFSTLTSCILGIYSYLFRLANEKMLIRFGAEEREKKKMRRKKRQICESRDVILPMYYSRLILTRIEICLRIRCALPKARQLFSSVDTRVRTFIYVNVCLDIVHRVGDARLYEKGTTNSRTHYEDECKYVRTYISITRFSSL